MTWHTNLEYKYANIEKTWNENYLRACVSVSGRI